MRGGICLCANTHGEQINGLYVYDVNSLYPYIAANMDELHKPRASSWDAYATDAELKSAYIITIDDLEVRLKPNRIPVLKGRDGACVYGGICATKSNRLSFFLKSLRKWSNTMI